MTVAVKNLHKSVKFLHKASDYQLFIISLQILRIDCKCGYDIS